jgi:hypothetical protein
VNSPGVRRKTGGEVFRSGDQPVGFDLLAFWQWASSNLVSNAFRGSLAEFLVKIAVKAEGETRGTWETVDLIAKCGAKIEVKSSAFIQDWSKERGLSRPRFEIKPSREWDESKGQRADFAVRHSDVYVFCLLHHEDRKTIDPMDVAQWTFFVLPTYVIDRDFPKQQSLSLGKLKTHKDVKVATWHQLGETVETAFKLVVE